MDAQSVVLAVLVGILQGVFEWLPISSEGNVTIALTVAGLSPVAAVQFSLFLHAGTAVSAAAYYRDELAASLAGASNWRPASAFDDDSADLSFLAVATLVTGAVGLPAYLLLEETVSALTGGAFVALIGALLVVTGLLQRFAGGLALGDRETPDLVDAVVVGALQGIAILPGVSRSGTTVSGLLLRGHDGPASFRLSFMLSIPAALGAGVITVADDGVAGIALSTALIALATSAVVGFVTIDALVRIVDRVPFWQVCLGLGTLAILGGATAVLV